MRIFKPMAITLATTLLASTSAHASGFPTFDATALAQSILELEQLAQSVQHGLDTVAAAEGMLEGISGIRNMGDLLNTDFEKAFRNHIPGTFNEVLDLENSGSDASTYVDNIKQIYQPAMADEIWADTTTPVAQRYQRGVNYTVNTLAISESAYVVASERNKTIEALQAELNSTTDLKASVDLQSRILIEQSYINNELVRLQSLALQGMADTKAQQFEITAARRRTFEEPNY